MVPGSKRFYTTILRGDDHALKTMDKVFRRILVDRSLIQNKMNLPQKQECHHCHSKKSDKHMSNKRLCKECADKLNRLEKRRKRQADNTERRGVWLRQQAAHRVWLADRKKKRSA
jgi:hypothetical protein